MNDEVGFDGFVHRSSFIVSLRRIALATSEQGFLEVCKDTGPELPEIIHCKNVSGR
jgi:hypothetical protein